MTDKQRDAILSLCDLIRKVMCSNCDKGNCNGCTMTDWMDEIKRPFEEGETE